MLSSYIFLYIHTYTHAPAYMRLKHREDKPKVLDIVVVTSFYFKDYGAVSILVWVGS